MSKYRVVYICDRCGKDSPASAPLSGDDIAAWPDGWHLVDMRDGKPQVSCPDCITGEDLGWQHWCKGVGALSYAVQRIKNGAWSVGRHDEHRHYRDLVYGIERCPWCGELL